MTVSGYSPLPRVEAGSMRHGTVKTLRVGGGTDASMAKDVVMVLLQACLASSRPALVIEALFEEDVRFALELISEAACPRSVRVGVVIQGMTHKTELTSRHPLAFFRPDQMSALLSWIEQ